MIESPDFRKLRWLMRRPLAVCVTLYVGLIIWGGLVPFSFPRDAADALSTVHWLLPASTDVDFPDAVANVLAYLPIGLLLRALLIRSRWSAAGSILGAAIFCCGLSLAIETAQAFAPTRSSSLLDVLCNVCGGAVGAGLHALVALVCAVLWPQAQRAPAHDQAPGEPLHTGMVRWLEDVSSRPVALVAQAWAVFIAIACLAPFDVAVSTNRLVASVRDTTLIPFARAARMGRDVWPGTLFASADWPGATTDLWQLRLDYAWTVLAYAVLAVLLCRYLSRHCRVHGARRARLAIAACGMLAIAISLAQLFIMSRSADITCVLLALTGALGGVLISDRVLRAWSPDATSGGPFAPAGSRRLVTCAALLIGAYLAARQLAPFEFETSAESVRAQLQSVEWTPLQMYQKARLPIAVDDFVHKALQWSALAVAYCLYRRHRGTSDHRQPILITAAAAIAFSAILECAQLLLPARSPAITDVLVAPVAVATSVCAYRLAAAGFIAIGLIRPLEAERIIYNVELGPPSEGPRERVPSQISKIEQNI